MIINLISSPRNVSTALMYSFAQHPGIKVVDEPFYGYYLQTFGVDHPGKADILATMETDFGQVVEQVDKLQSEHTHIFLKNMAHHLLNTPVDFMMDWKNIVFIRDPEELITSFAKVIENPTMQDIGVKHQAELFDQLKTHGQYPPIVVDSAELIRHPEKLLRLLCNQLAIAFDPKMLSWNKGGIPEDGVWAKYWYANVHNSTGFDPAKTKKPVLPTHCEPLYKEALPYFNELSKHALKIS